MVIKGFLQIQGINYNKTFATTASATSAQIILTLATRHQWHMTCADAVGAYFSGDPLKETIYMYQFPGLALYFERYPKEKITHNYRNDYAIQLILPLYGLKQSGRNWQ